MSSRGTAAKLFRFGLVGVAGFAVDSGVLMLCLRFTPLGPYASRPLSFGAAVTTTWLLNRRFTFDSRDDPLPEYLRFIAANSLGALVNLAVYSLFIWVVGARGGRPVLGVAAGSLCGLVVNFCLSDRLVFRQSRAG